METATNQQLQAPVARATAAKQLQNFPQIDQETRSHVPTSCAAFHLNRKPQTLNSWAYLGQGPIRPIHINGRLAWPVAGIKNLLNGEGA
jgi:hypothetical protein